MLVNSFLFTPFSFLSFLCVRSVCASGPELEMKMGGGGGERGCRNKIPLVQQDKRHSQRVRISPYQAKLMVKFLLGIFQLDASMCLCETSVIIATAMFRKQHYLSHKQGNLISLSLRDKPVLVREREREISGVLC